MRTVRGTDELKATSIHELRVWTIYLQEMSQYDNSDAKAKKQFSFISDLIYTTKYIVTENTIPVDHFAKKDKATASTLNPDLIDLITSPTELDVEQNGEGTTDKNASEEELEEIDDFDPKKEFEKEYKYSQRIWDRKEGKKEFFGAPHFYNRAGLFTAFDGGAERIDFVIEQEDEEWFSLFFAFKLRQLDIISEVEEFLSYWNQQFEKDFSSFLELIQIKYKPLFRKELKKSIKVFKNRDSTKKGHPTSFNKSEEPEEKKIITMNRELLTIVIIYFTKYHDIDISKIDTMRFLALLTDSEAKTATNTNFKKHVNKHTNPKYKTPKEDLKKLEKAAELFDQANLTYIRDFILKDISKIKEKLKKT